MTRGKVISYDADEETGYIDPDDGDERIPFDKESLESFEGDPQIGDLVSFVVEGGLAGIYAAHVRRVSRR